MCVLGVSGFIEHRQHVGSKALLLLPSRFSRVRLCTTPQPAAHQAPLSLGFSRQECWSGVPFPSPTKALQACPTLRDPVDCSPPGSAVYGILQAKILERIVQRGSYEGIFPTQGWTLRLLSLLHWQADSLPLVPPGDTWTFWANQKCSSPVLSVLVFLGIKITIDDIYLALSLCSIYLMS